MLLKSVIADMFVFIKSCSGLVLSALLIGFSNTADIPESVFPKGPFALPMSSDGCPEESSRGWNEGYISITTSTLFNQSKAYLSSCRGLNIDILTIGYSFRSGSNTNILHTFDSDTIRWNFCFKSADHPINTAASWPDEIYGIFGAVEGCPDGFDTHDIKSCLPPVLHYNSDGHLPYFNIEVNTNNSVLTLRYCRRVRMIKESQSSQTLDSLYPFFVIQDPQANGCPNVEGYTVSSEIFPGPIYSMILDTNVSFALTFCYFVNYMFEYVELERHNNEIQRAVIILTNYDFQEDTNIENNSTSFKDYTGGSFLDIQIFLPPAEQFILGADGAVESWLMIDARRTFLVSGIAFQTFWFDGATPSFHRTNGMQAQVSRIFVADERWSFLYGGALRCRFSIFTSVDVWYWYVQAGVDTYNCLRSQLGRHITVIFNSSEPLGDILLYNDTFISVITNEEEKDLKIQRCNEELGMNNYEIKDSHLTASSWQEAYPPSQARPWQSGWCATRGDRQPYIQIDLQGKTKVDGVVLRYWYGVEDTAICDTVLGGTKPEGSYIFSLEYGSVLSQMRTYKDKTFVYDITQTLKSPQTYLLAETVEARFFRILTASFSNSSAPCIKFELLGCRKSYNPDITKYGTKIDQHLAVYFEVPNIRINQAQMLSSFGYPASYDYNIFYKWNISIPNGFAFLQFEDISLRTFGSNEFSNNMGCVDHIIVTEFDVVNPFTIVKDYYLYVNTQSSLKYIMNSLIRILLTSKDNGKMPGIPGTGEERGSLYVAFLSCSAGNVIAPGRGFRAYVANADFPVCMSVEDHNNICAKRGMVLISPRFLGMASPSTVYIYTVENIPAVVLMKVKVIDFEISCNAESIFRFVVRDGSLAFCNEDIFEEKLFMADYFVVRYTKGTLPSCEDQVLLEGFHLKYEMINREDWLPDYNLIVQENNETTVYTEYGPLEFIKKEVCFSSFQKCYSLEFQQTSWTDAAYFCRSKNMQMVTIKSKQELLYLQQLLIDVHGPNIRHLESNFMYFSTAEMFIGLLRFQDISGVQHEHWIDGTPLAISAWSENQPADILLKKCTKMVFNPEEVGKEDTWETESCDLKSEAVYVVCEYDIDDPDRSQKISEKLDDCYETTASEYQGNVSRTRYGHVCQKWTNRTPNNHFFTRRKDFPDSKIKDASNYCRSPDGADTPWCFTMDEMIPWDYCQIPKCSSAEELEPLPKDPVTLFRCNSGECMSHTVRCNNISECLDSSDEDNCTTSSELCNSDEFTCADGRCIHMYRVCNYIADCNDASDEFCDFRSCDSETEFKCDNGECITLAKRCDSVKHCKDGSDEILCESCNPDRAFQCGDRSCISKRLICDLRVDCSDGSDENMCNHVYETCDQVWQDGLTQDGTYLTGCQSYRTLCQFNKTSGLLTMQYLNTDWRRMDSTSYQISFPDFTLVSKYTKTHGYICSQQIDEVPHREMQRVMAFKNVEQDPLSAKYLHNDNQYISNDVHFDVTDDMIYLFKTFNRSEKRLDVHDIRCVKGLSSWKNTSFCIRDLKSEKQMRWCSDEMKFSLHPHRCESWEKCGENRWNENIHCSKGKFIERNQMCIYDYDENSIKTGCRTLNHLQNCENVPCPKYHFKCPRSYCLPLMYVCNGRIDCPNGADEKECGVDHQQNRSIVIVVPSSDIIPLDRSALISETAARFGGTLYSDQSQVRVIKLRQLNKNRFLLESREVMSNSEYPNKLFDTYDLNEADQTWELLFGVMNQNQDAAKAFLWLTDTPEYTYAEDFVFSSFRNTNVSKTVLKYRIVTGPHSQKDFTVSRQSDVTEVKIRDLNILGTLGPILFPDIYKGKPVACNGKYRCSLSLVCIPFVQVCDGRSQCPYGDDELECDFICPDRCTCKPLIVSCANVHFSSNETIFIHETTRVIDASNTSNLGSVILLKPEKNNFHHLISLNISRCGIEFLSGSSFQNLQNLLTLDISFNKLTKLVRDTFVNLRFLRELHMTENHYLQKIEPGAFNGLQIEYLVINNAQLESLSPNTFYGLNLKILDLSRNRIKTIIDLTFNGLISQDIYLVDNPILDFSKKMFDGVTGVENLKTPAYKFCCIRPSYLNEESCLPHRDEFSSCQNLMRNTTLQALMWVIGFLALIGNILSVLYRLIYDRKRLKLGYGMFVTNLAISDFLMGVYMLIIAVADKMFMDRYIEVDEYWRNSSWCQLAGAISTISSEASVLFMCLITIDRILVVKFPFGQYRFNTFSACMSIGLAWIISFIIAVLPVLYEDFFQGKFYSKSGVCLALPLTRDRPPGWLYAILIFVGFNLITFTLIAAGQLLIYMEIRKQSKMKKRMHVNRTNDLRVARNLLLLVATDFMCWFPVGLMGILAMAGYVIPGEMYAWTAVLILPINSALNPFMYTFAAIIGSKALQPSVLEQAMIEPSTENAKVLLRILPYTVMHSGSTNSTICSLSKLLKIRSLGIEEAVCVIHVLTRYIELLHDSSMVLGDIYGRHIMITLSSDYKTMKAVKIWKTPLLSSQKRGQANDICNIGNITEILINSVRK